MLSDIEIAQRAKLRPIKDIASSIGIDSEDLEFYGKYKAKLPVNVIKAHKNPNKPKLVLVTAMNPTPAGEGKTTTSIGLAQGLKLEGETPVLALREPSLGPVFGVKGGACGGGYSQVIPMEDINLHFTGDIHAITTANNLLSAMIDNHIYQGNELNIDISSISWRRCLDMNDRSLRHITVGVGGGKNGVTRDEGFNITAASEVMAILCLASDFDDLKTKLAQIIIGKSTDGKDITAGDLNAAGAMASVLKDAISPNLVQTLEGVPVFIHGGPFANISHGCNSVIATTAALKYGSIAITEAGFGADLGAEKFIDIKCRQMGVMPDCAVIVATCRSLKYNAGVARESLSEPAADKVAEGFANLAKHIGNMRSLGIPVVVAANRFASDTDEELEVMRSMCEELGAAFAPSDVFMDGGEGGRKLARAVLEHIKANESDKSVPEFTYNLEDSITDKIRAVATKIYGAKDISLSPEAVAKIEEITKSGFGGLPICIAKTQYSLSDDPKALGRPEGFTLNVRELRLAAGAGYVVVLTGSILTMPGLPKKPAAEDIDVTADGTITGLF